MFFASAAVLYGAVTVLARRGHSRYSAVLAVMGAPFPFLVRALIPPVCTLFAHRSPTPPAVTAALWLGIASGVLVTGLAIVLRSELAESTATLRARQPN